jgi:hypothetical protein
LVINRFGDGERLVEYSRGRERGFWWRSVYRVACKRVSG